MQPTSPHLIPGFHAVREALRAGGGLGEIWVSKDRGAPRVREILSLADEHKVRVRFKSAAEISRLLPDFAHQGIVGLVREYAYAGLESLVEAALGDPDGALLLAADHITDEGNLGALIRSAAFFGAHGLILPKDRSARMSARVLKRSSGAQAHLPVARVVNLGRGLAEASSRGIWIVGASGEGSVSVWDFDWRRPLVLVLGNEERGLSPSARSRCHAVVGIPGRGAVDSLNVAVAAAVILAEIRRQRKAGGG